MILVFFLLSKRKCIDRILRQIYRMGIYIDAEGLSLWDRFTVDAVTRPKKSEEEDDADVYEKNEKGQVCYIL